MENIIFSFNFIVGAGIVFVLIILAVLFFLPSEDQKVKKDRKLQAEEMALKRDWKMTAHRLEELVKSLNKDIDVLQDKEKTYEKQIAVEKARVTKLKEKLEQEHTWHQREQTDLDKKMKDAQSLKVELVKSQENYAQEHALTLKLKSELLNVKKDRDDINDERRKFEAETLEMKSKIEKYMQEITRLKKENIDLSKKKEDTAWVAKADYIILENKFKVAEKELERVRRQAG